MAVGTGSHFTCQSFLFAKPNCFRKTQAKIQSSGVCWVCRYNFTTGAVCGQCTGWEALRRSGELHRSIPIVQGAQRGQKTFHWSWKMHAKVLSCWGKFRGQHQLPAAFQALTFGGLDCLLSLTGSRRFFVYGYSERHARELSHITFLFPISIQMDGPIQRSRNMGQKIRLRDLQFLNCYLAPQARVYPMSTTASSSLNSKQSLHFVLQGNLPTHQCGSSRFGLKCGS